MKKIVALLMASAMAASLAACGGSAQSSEATSAAPAGSNTTNPGTGANDVVGVAAALAGVALVSGAAISPEK